MQPVTLTQSLYTRATKHRQFGNKEQVKTMVSITSCNPVVVNCQVHRKAAGKEDRQKEVFHLRLQRHTLSTF